MQVINGYRRQSDGQFHVSRLPLHPIHCLPLKRCNDTLPTVKDEAQSRWGLALLLALFPTLHLALVLALHLALHLALLLALLLALHLTLHLASLRLFLTSFVFSYSSFSVLCLYLLNIVFFSISSPSCSSPSLSTHPLIRPLPSAILHSLVLLLLLIFSPSPLCPSFFPRSLSCSSTSSIPYTLRLLN